MTTIKRGRGRPKQAPTSVIRVPSTLASIIREKGTGWVLETLQKEIKSAEYKSMWVKYAEGLEK